MNERQTVAGAYARIDAHEDLCAERYKNIHDGISSVQKSVDQLFSRFWAAAMTLIMVLVGLLGFFATKFYEANDPRLSGAPPGVQAARTLAPP